MFSPIFGIEKKEAWGPYHLLSIFWPLKAAKLSCPDLSPSWKSPPNSSTCLPLLSQGRLTRTCHNSVSSFCCGQRSLLRALSKMKWCKWMCHCKCPAPLIYDLGSRFTQFCQVTEWFVITRSGDNLAEPKWYLNGTAEIPALKTPHKSVYSNCLFTGYPLGRWTWSRLCYVPFTWPAGLSLVSCSPLPQAPEFSPTSLWNRPSNEDRG